MHYLRRGISIAENVLLKVVLKELLMILLCVANTMCRTKNEPEGKIAKINIWKIKGDASPLRCLLDRLIWCSSLSPRGFQERRIF